ncbi:hydantoin racemase [Rhizobium sp. AC44/96]|uniref:aspartate/glutamate racemase family protein n=1 Tax=unclassified Rhizobium TaxID=2613769 RepID=UPI00080F97C8|nr:MULTISPECIES: aspartate/glutamate racemase family protein [unclassified Rhizobium]MDM9623110.1 aspartate/glutamate racemase family protein [Rhizobium sp. S96]OCJ13013.1 hydantoin racemase [Rhizobium sp. AC44/96]
MMKHILLINPNSSQATTSMMLAIAETAAEGRVAVVGATATRSPSMIVMPAELEASAAEVVEIGQAHAPDCVGIIVSAFGDPGAVELRRRVSVPVVGICEASMLEAAAGGRRFGVATTTPDLLDAIDQHAYRLGLDAQYCGIRCTADDPRTLVGDPRALHDNLAIEVQKSFEEDRAQAVIIGGGPLGHAAEVLKATFEHPVLSPIACAVRYLQNRAA